MAMAVANPAFVIAAGEVQRMLASCSISMESLLSKLVAPTKALARPPISHYYVGAVGLGASGRIFLGVNLEFVGLPLGTAVHAEQFLIANAAQHGERSLQMIAVSAAPCGHCRQFMQELRGAPDINILIVDAEAETQTLEHFLPHRFGPNDVLDGEFPLILEPRTNGLFCLEEGSPDQAGNVDAHGKGHSLGVSLSGCNGIMRGTIMDGNCNSLHCYDVGLSEFQRSQDKQDQCGMRQDSPADSDFVNMGERVADLKAAALEAANSSHAPYTNCPSGVALLTRKGSIYSGSYMESVAYNPSLPPLQAALVAFVARDGGSYHDIVQAVLVEKQGAVMQFAATVQLQLKSISPYCRFSVCYASKEA